MQSVSHLLLHYDSCWLMSRLQRMFNTGSPWNVPAGQTANLDELIAKYQKEAYEANEKKLQQLRENKVPAEQPYDSNVTRA